MTTVLIEHGRLVTLADDEAPGDAIRGWIFVRDDRIEDLGAGDAPIPLRGADTVIDATGQVVMPGLVNAHTHLFQTFARGTGDDLPLLEWVEKAILPITTHLTASDAKAAATVGLVENIRSGATSVLEHQYVRAEGADHATCEAALEVGARMTIARGWADIIELELYRESIEEFERGTRALHEAWDGAEGRISVETGPLVPWACSDEAMLRSKAMADELGCGMHIHCAETSAEIELADQRNGLGHVEWLDKLGLLSPSTQLAHTVWVNDHELDLIAESGAVVVHCPVSNMYLASGIAPITEMLRRDITVALATDGPGSNNSQDMFETMKAAVLLQKIDHLDAASLGPLDALRMACRGGAAALGAEESLGCLEPGRLADIIVVDLATAFATPVHRAHSALVFNASARDVTSVLVGGNVVMRNRELTTVDEKAVLAQANAACRDLFDRAGLSSEITQP